MSPENTSGEQKPLIAPEISALAQSVFAAFPQAKTEKIFSWQSVEKPVGILIYMPEGVNPYDTPQLCVINHEGNIIVDDDKKQHDIVYLLDRVNQAFTQGRLDCMEETLAKLPKAYRDVLAMAVLAKMQPTVFEQSPTNVS